jgi:hypothetical protein
MMPVRVEVGRNIKNVVVFKHSCTKMKNLNLNKHKAVFSTNKKADFRSFEAKIGFFWHFY